MRALIKKHRKEKHMRKKCITGLLLISLCTGLVIPARGNAAQKKWKLNVTKKTLTVKKSTTLKAKGKAKIRATILIKGKKKATLTCNIKVKKAAKTSVAKTSTPKSSTNPVVSALPSVAPTTVTPTTAPTASSIPAPTRSLLRQELLARRISCQTRSFLTYSRILTKPMHRRSKQMVKTIRSQQTAMLPIRRQSPTTAECMSI